MEWKSPPDFPLVRIRLPLELCAAVALALCVAGGILGWRLAALSHVHARWVGCVGAALAAGAVALPIRRFLWARARDYHVPGSVFGFGSPKFVFLMQALLSLPFFVLGCALVVIGVWANAWTP